MFIYIFIYLDFCLITRHIKAKHTRYIKCVVQKSLKKREKE